MDTLPLRFVFKNVMTTLSRTSLCACSFRLRFLHWNKLFSLKELPKAMHRPDFLSPHLEICSAHSIILRTLRATLNYISQKGPHIRVSPLARGYWSVVYSGQATSAPSLKIPHIPEGRRNRWHRDVYTVFNSHGDPLHQWNPACCMFGLLERCKRMQLRGPGYGSVL